MANCKLIGTLERSVTEVTNPNGNTTRVYTLNVARRNGVIDRIPVRVNANSVASKRAMENYIEKGTMIVVHGVVNACLRYVRDFVTIPKEKQFNYPLYKFPYIYINATSISSYAHPDEKELYKINNVIDYTGYIYTNTILHNVKDDKVSLNFKMYRLPFEEVNLPKAIPTVIWNSNADLLNSCAEIGKKIKVTGRIQTREVQAPYYRVSDSQYKVNLLIAEFSGSTIEIL